MRYVFLFFLLALAIMPLPVAAQEIDINTYVQFAMGLGVLLAVLMFAVGGVQYMLSDAITDKSDAKDRMVSAIVGLLILLGTALILNTINPRILSSVELGTIFRPLTGLQLPNTTSPLPNGRCPAGQRIEIDSGPWVGVVRIYTDLGDGTCSGPTRLLRVQSANNAGCRALGNNLIRTGNFSDGSGRSTPTNVGCSTWRDECRTTYTRSCVADEDAPRTSSPSPLIPPATGPTVLVPGI